MIKIQHGKKFTNRNKGQGLVEVALEAGQALTRRREDEVDGDSFRVIAAAGRKTSRPLSPGVPCNCGPPR